jgi:hypothetical protein
LGAPLTPSAWQLTQFSKPFIGCVIFIDGVGVILVDGEPPPQPERSIDIKRKMMKMLVTALNLVYLPMRPSLLTYRPLYRIPD